MLLKSVEGVKPLQFQAWVGFSSLWPIAALSLLLEHDQTAVLRTHLWPFIGGVLFTSLVVSVIAHTTYYGLIQRYEATLLQPLTLLAPLGTIALGVWITHDVFDLRMAIGSALALAGVLIIAIRRNHVMPMILAVRNWAQ